jgi:hypothetical protein
MVVNLEEEEERNEERTLCTVAILNFKSTPAEALPKFLHIYTHIAYPT